MKPLYIITARKGSKGIPNKNMRILDGAPLVSFSIRHALAMTDAADICVSTDDERIADLSKDLGVPVPFMRPAELSVDGSTSRDVMLHAIDHYGSKGKSYPEIVLLQPTSPFRTPEHILKAIELFDDSLDMVTTVRLADPNPYYAVFEAGADGLLKKTMPQTISSRQECPPCYEFNGAVYVIKTESLRRANVTEFERVKMVEMSETESLDLDTELDWQFAEFLLDRGIVNLRPEWR